MGNIAKFLVFAILTTIAALSLAACGDGTGIEPAESDRTEDAPSETAAKIAGTSGFLELLEVIPENAHTRSWVQVNDYQRFRETFDIQLPGPDAGEEALLDYLMQPPERSQFYGPFISGYGPTGNQTLGMRRYLGFDLRNVLRSAEAGVPPNALEVVQGEFDPNKTALALAACAECEAPEETERHGTKFYSWGEDLAASFQKVYAPPAYDRLGRGGRIAVLDEYVFRTVETGGMEALIDARRGDRSSLAGVDDFRVLAAGLDELNAYSGLLSDNTQNLSEFLVDKLGGVGSTVTQEELSRLRDKLKSEPLLRPYDAFATGAGRDNRGQYMVVVLVHSSDRAAQRNVELLRQRIEETQSLWINQPWSDFFEEMEIRAEGSVLLGKLYGERTRSLWLSFILQRDPLLLHE